MIFFANLQREDGIDGMVASSLEPVGPHGRVALPFGSHTLVNPLTWDGSLPHEVVTRCGVISTVYQGRLWLADPPLHMEELEKAGGYGLTYTKEVGFIRLLERGVAEFEAIAGWTVRFVEAPLGARDPLEDCPSAG